ncbi:jg17992 [Pararge aegeria aegeria]|uniref:Jg17992 protein n=1 Tax=Pararge aegeria aegeria TaxID=348720 RepID=A0A8S4RZS5_9NEOP|nr:jg17992 [Pararge aegeria aegeria]
MAYGAETWTLTKKVVHRLKVVQRAMERAMLGLSLLDKILNVEIRIPERCSEAAALKWNWAGPICRREDGRWSRVILYWQPRTEHRSIGRPPARWRDDIVKAVGKNWMQVTSNRPRWRANEESSSGLRLMMMMILNNT